MSLSLPRRLGRALFRVHIENGLSVSLGMAVVGLSAALAFGLDTGVLVAAGALCASVVDLPGTVPIKLKMFAAALVTATAVMFFSTLAVSSAWLLALVVAGLSFTSGILTAYGRRALGLGVGMVLALLYGMAAPAGGLGNAAIRAGAFAAGAIAYSGFALAVAFLLDDRNRRLFLAEAVRAFASYVRAKAALYDTNARARAALSGLIEAHANFVERLQAARDTIFAGRGTERRQRWTAGLIALLDCFDGTLSGDADIDIMRRSAHRHLMRRIHRFIAGLADDIEQLSLALATPGGSFFFSDTGRDAELEEIGAEVQRLAKAAAEAGGGEPLAISAFRSAYNKLVQTRMSLKQLAQATDRRRHERVLPARVDLSAFMQTESMNPAILKSQFTLASPSMRYALRLTLAMLAGYGLTLAFPQWVHGGWILLTIALIMRANYSVTRRRRDDRVVGTFAGCIAAAALIYVLPREWLFVPIIIAVGSAHAFGTVDYRITALSASISALLQLHFLDASSVFLVVDRMLDTLAGAGLAWLFSFFWPTWERRNVPRLVAAMIAADRAYAAEALRRARNDQTYRLARKRAHDATANLTMTLRRLSDEPRMDRRALVALSDLLAANYTLASDLASMRVLFILRTDELDPAAADAVLETARANVLSVLDAIGTDRPEPAGRLSRRSIGDLLGGANAMVSLRRRLIHIERSAERVATLAVKATGAIGT